MLHESETSSETLISSSPPSSSISVKQSLIARLFTPCCHRASSLPDVAFSFSFCSIGIVVRIFFFSLNRPERDIFMFLRQVCSLKTESSRESSKVSSLSRLELLLDTGWEALEAAGEDFAQGSKFTSKAWSLAAFFFGRNAFHHGVLSVIFD